MPYVPNYNSAFFQRLRRNLNIVYPFNDNMVIPTISVDSPDAYAETQDIVPLSAAGASASAAGTLGNAQTNKATYLSAVSISWLKNGVGSTGILAQANVIINGVSTPLISLQSSAAATSGAILDSMSFNPPIKIDSIANNVNITSDVNTNSVLKGTFIGYELYGV